MNDESRTSADDRDLALAGLALERGLITVEQYVEAQAEQVRRGGSVGEILAARGQLSARALASLREELGAVPPPPRPFPEPLAPGRPFGKYRLVGEVGRGGMGIVYHALDTELGRKVALKLMIQSPAADPKARAVEEALFAREGQLCARLEKHPNIVSVYEAGSLDGRRYIAMEHVEGQPMSDWRRNAGAPLRTQVRLLRDVALAVHHAHEGGILHRDLKPRNVLVDGRGRPCVTDFGLAKGMAREFGGSSTTAGTVVGTPSYMSPEQAQGSKAIDRRTDVYALGAMLYEVLTGRPPFAGESSIVALMSVVQEPVVPPSQASPGWAASPEDKSIEGVCLRALAKRPQERYATAKEFAEALSAWLEERPAGRPASRPRLPAWIPGAAAVAVAAVAALAITWRPAAPPPSPSAGTVDLLSLVDPSKDGLSGAWKRERDRLACGSAPLARIQVPYRPPAEYDLRLAFARLEGEGEVNVVLSRGGRPFLWSMGASDNRFFGFAEIGGKGAHENDTSVRRTSCLENGRPYELVLHVRKDAVRAYLDGILVTEARGGLDLQGEWRPPDPDLLGLGARRSAAEFSRIEILEVSGRGRPAR